MTVSSKDFAPRNSNLRHPDSGHHPDCICEQCRVWHTAMLEVEELTAKIPKPPKVVKPPNPILDLSEREFLTIRQALETVNINTLLSVRKGIVTWTNSKQDIRELITKLDGIAHQILFQ